MIADDLQYRLEEVLDVDPDSISADLARSGPEVQVIPDPIAMFDHELSVNTVLGAIAQASPQGVQTTTAFLEPDGTETPIEVRYIDEFEENPIGLDELRQLPILTPAGEFTAMEEVARVRTDEGRNTILRTDQSRRVVFTYRFTAEVLDSQPRIDSARSLVRLVISDMVLPPGYTVEVTEAEVDTIYYWMMGIAALLVYMILASLFESFSSPIVIFCTLPTAVIGSCIALAADRHGPHLGGRPHGAAGICRAHRHRGQQRHHPHRCGYQLAQARLPARARRDERRALARAAHLDDVVDDPCLVCFRWRSSSVVTSRSGRRLRSPWSAVWRYRWYRR